MANVHDMANNERQDEQTRRDTQRGGSMDGVTQCTRHEDHRHIDANTGTGTGGNGYRYGE